MNRQELFDAMLNRTRILYKGEWLLINGIEMEDGSGQSFNLKLSGMTDRWVYYRCVGIRNRMLSLDI